MNDNINSSKYSATQTASWILEDLSASGIRWGEIQYIGDSNKIIGEMRAFWATIPWTAIHVRNKIAKQHILETVHSLRWIHSISSWYFFYVSLLSRIQRRNT